MASASDVAFPFGLVGLAIVVTLAAGIVGIAGLTGFLVQDYVKDRRRSDLRAPRR